MSQALLPVLVVTREDSNPSLLPKQVGGLGLWCPITVCLPFLPIGSVQTFLNPSDIDIDKKHWLIIVTKLQNQTVYTEGNRDWEWTLNTLLCAYCKEIMDHCRRSRGSGRIWPKCSLLVPNRSISDLSTIPSCLFHFRVIIQLSLITKTFMHIVFF